MQDQILTLVLVLLGLALGGLLGWLAGSRPAADLRTRLAAGESSGKELEEKFRRSIIDLENATVRADRADDLDNRVENLGRELNESNLALTRLQSELSEREKAFNARVSDREAQFVRELKRLSDAEEKLQVKFGEIGERMLAGAQEKFLEGAGNHLATLSKESLAELEKKVGPVEHTLERYRLRVEELEKNRSGDFERLHGVIGLMRDGQERVVDGANRIATTLRGASKARGDWGELQLENLLESCGLYDKADFNFQVTVRGEEGNILRPDAILNIPGNRRLVVDVKNVFNTYASANEADSEEERQALLKAHARELRGHIDDLSSKRYQDHVPGSADFVVLFVPGEHVLYAALTQDNGLLDYALKRQIVLSSPLNFMSIALTVSTVWRQAGVQADVEEIAKLGKEIYDRLGIVAGHLSAVRKSLYSTNQHFDSLIGSFDTNLRRTGERFEQLSVDTSAQNLNEALPIGHQPRKLSNFADSDESEAAE